MPVKVCGVTRPADAVAAVELGATHIGLNFHPPSPRCLELDPARRVADAVRGRAALVGVFVARPAAEIEAIDRQLGLDLIQLHGDEPPAEVARWGGRALKVFRIAAGAETAADEVSRLDLDAYPHAWGFLFDIRHGSLYGGTGTAWSYGSLAPLAAAGRPYFVAGGIAPDNARRALADSGASGLDVCSGVESAPGIKDLSKLERLFAEIHHG